MTEPPDLRELVGDDVPEQELARLRQVDALLRATPSPPVVTCPVEPRQADQGVTSQSPEGNNPCVV